MQFDGVLCDLDGTLIDSEHIHLDAWNSVAERYGHFPDSAWNDDCIGLPDIFTEAKLIRMYPELGAHGNLLAEKQDVFLEMVVAKGDSLVFLGVREKIIQLAQAGKKLAVCTNSVMRNTRAALKGAGVLEFFPVIVTLDRVAKGKPDPEIYQTGADELGLDPANCLVVEDSPAGIASGKAAGCTVVGVTNTWPQDKLPGADFYCADTPSAFALVLNGKAHHAG